MDFGYGRVSTRDQNPDSQWDILTAANVTRENIYVDKASGKLRTRPQLDAVLRTLRAGDTLKVTKLDRLSRSLRDLDDIARTLAEREVTLHIVSSGMTVNIKDPIGKMFYRILAMFAEFEHDMIVDRTLDGLAAARSRGRKGGRKAKMTPTKIEQARRMYDGREHTVQQIAETFGVTRATIYRHLEQLASISD